MIRPVVDVPLPISGSVAGGLDVSVVGPDGGVVVRPVFLDEAGDVRVRFRASRPVRYRR